MIDDDQIDSDGHFLPPYASGTTTWRPRVCVPLRQPMAVAPATAAADADDWCAEFPEPDDGVRHDATDAMRYTRLRRGGRPPTHGSASLSKPLFGKLVAANFFKDGWATDPADRPTAADMLGRFREAQQA